MKTTEHDFSLPKKFISTLDIIKTTQEDFDFNFASLKREVSISKKQQKDRREQNYQKPYAFYV